MVPQIFIFVFLCLVGTSWCDSRNVKNHDVIEEIHKRFARQIAPGTKWCGNGDRAINNEDLGYHRITDECCREHDKCPLNIAGRETKYGLKNPDRFTRSHCDCDKIFYECLVNASSRMSRTIGEIYFNFLGKKCFRNKQCPGGITCKEKYEWVEGTAWLPTENELRRMYNLMALFVPELEIDPFEDYVLGRVGNRVANNTMISR